MSSDTKTQTPAEEAPSVIELRDRAIKDAENFVSVMRYFRNVKNAPFKMSADDIDESMKFVVFSQFAGIPAQVNKKVNLDFHRQFTEGNVLHELIERQRKNLLIVAEGQIGTHTGKVPNPTVKEPTALFADVNVFKEAAKTSRVSTATIRCGQRVGAAGNAAQIRAQRLLATRLEIDGVPVDMVDDIAAKGPVWESLGRIGFDDAILESISEIVRGRLFGAVSVGSAGKKAKQLIWPTEGGDVVITPVHPYAMHLEFARRLEERRQRGSRIDTTFTVVDGAQPQNAGLVNKDMGGWHRMLIGSPPTMDSFESRIVYRDAACGKIELNKAKGPAVKELDKLLKATHRTNRESRRALERVIRQVIVGICMPLIWFRDAAWHDDVNPEKISSPKWAQPLLTSGYDGIGEWRDRLLGDVVNRVFESVDTKILGAGDDANDLRTVMEKVAEEFFSDVFKGA